MLRYRRHKDFSDPVHDASSLRRDHDFMTTSHDEPDPASLAGPENTKTLLYIGIFFAGIAVFFAFQECVAREQGRLVLDWAIFVDSMTGLSKMRLPVTLWESFNEPVNHFSVHGHFLLAALAPLLKIPGAHSVFFALCVAIADFSLALALVVLMVRILSVSRGDRLAFPAAFFLAAYLPFWSQAAPGFHPETFAVLGLAGFAVGIMHGRTALAAVAGILAALTREEMGIVLLLLAGAMFMTEKGCGKRIVAAAAPGIIVAAISAALVHSLKATADDGGFIKQIIASRYEDWKTIFSDNPLTFFDDRWERLRFLLVVVAPMAPAWVAAGRRSFWLIAAAPGLLVNLASSYQFQWSDAFYYQSSFQPVLAIVFAEGAARPMMKRKIRLTCCFALLALTMPFSHSLAFLTRGETTIPAGKDKVWRVADASVVRDARALADIAPQNASFAIGAPGLADYLERSSMPLEGAVKNSIDCDYVLLRTDGDNFDPHWDVSEKSLADYINASFRLVAKR